MFPLAARRSLQRLLVHTKSSYSQPFSVLHGLDTAILDYSRAIPEGKLEAELLPHISDRQPEKPTKLWNEKLLVDAYHGRRAEFMDKLLRMNEHGIKADAETWTAKIALFARLHSFGLMLEEVQAMEEQLGHGAPKFMWEGLVNGLYSSIKKTARFQEVGLIEADLLPSASLSTLADNTDNSNKEMLSPILSVIANYWRLLRAWDARDVEEKVVVPSSGFVPSTAFRGLELYSTDEAEEEAYEGSVQRVGVTGGTFVLDKVANLMRVAGQPWLLASLIDPAFVPAALLPPSTSASESSFYGVASQASGSEVGGRLDWQSPPSSSSSSSLSSSSPLSPPSSPSSSLYTLSSNYLIASSMLKRGLVDEARTFVETHQQMWASPAYFDEVVGAVALHRSVAEAEDLIYELKDQHKVIVSPVAWDGIAYALALNQQEAEIIRLRREEAYFHNRVKLHKFSKPFFVRGSELAQKVAEARARERKDRYEREKEGSILRKLNF